MIISNLLYHKIVSLNNHLSGKKNKLKKNIVFYVLNKLSINPFNVMSIKLNIQKKTFLYYIKLFS